MYSHYAFLSEAGNYHFDFDDIAATDHFVVSALLIEDDHIDDFLQKLDYMQPDLFPGENPSQDKKKLITQLMPLNFQLYVVVINKKKLRKDGAHGSLEPSFGFINEAIYRDLFTDHFNMLVHADDHGTPFLESFNHFIHKQHQPDLFDRSEFMYESSKKSRFLQLANIIANFILEAYEDDLSTLTKLSTKIIRLQIHPTFNYDLHTDNEHNHIIATQAISAAKDYIKKRQLSEEQVNIDRVNFLKYLLTQLSIKAHTYIYSQEIIDNMKTFSAEAISKDYLMRDIIGPLRDQGVLIASTTKGYKIPTSSKDLLDYVHFSSSMALPMLRRIKIAREIVLEDTGRQLDIIEGAEFKELREFFRV